MQSTARKADIRALVHFYRICGKFYDEVGVML